MNRLPPLRALHCFEAVGRHQALKAAAAELHVTPAAVSQQIGKLEQALGLSLFERHARGLRLTSEGSEYLRDVQHALSHVALATERLRQRHAPKSLTLSCTAGFAMQWLLPRLPDFHRRHPDLEVRLSTSNRLVDLETEPIEFAVRHGLGRYPGLESELLIDDPLVPLCAPQLLKRRRALASAQALESQVLLHDEHRDDWRLWLRAAGVRGALWRHGPVFTDSNGVVEAALQGRGVALLRPVLVNEAVAAGRLCVAWPQPLATPLAYHLVYRPGLLLRPEARAFRDWLRSVLS